MIDHDFWSEYKNLNYKLNNKVLFDSIENTRFDSQLIDKKYQKQFFIDCYGLITEKIIIFRRRIPVKFGRNLFFFSYI